MHNYQAEAIQQYTWYVCQISMQKDFKSIFMIV
jgi:hypothetical protein